jgi:hypothetical protein
MGSTPIAAAPGGNVARARVRSLRSTSLTRTALRLHRRLQISHDTEMITRPDCLELPFPRVPELIRGSVVNYDRQSERLRQFQLRYDGQRGRHPRSDCQIYSCAALNGHLLASTAPT